MIDIGKVRDDWKLVADNLARRGVDKKDVKKLWKIDEEWRELTQKVDELRARQNEANEVIAGASAKDKDRLIGEMKVVAADVKKGEARLAEMTRVRKTAWRALPNLVAEDVPEGEEDDFEIVRAVPEKVPDKDFEIKDYLYLGEGELFNLAEASRVSGSRFAYIIEELARLQIGLVAWVFDKLGKDELGDGRFIPIMPPVLIGQRAMSDMGYLGDHAEEVYKMADDNLYLVGTSEQSLGPMHIRKRYSRLKRPKRYVGYSSCFRREAGSHGKDVKGLMRLHQFEKIEMFSFTNPDESNKELDFLLSKQEEIMRALELPYRVIKLAAGDLGAPAAKTYDIETWIPSERRYRETHSTSNTTDYQARRLNIRVGKAGDTRFLHMLNGTALAMSRTFIALIENHQQADGSIAIPEVLHKYLPFKEIKKTASK